MKAALVILLSAPFVAGILVAMAAAYFVHWVVGETWRKHPGK